MLIAGSADLDLEAPLSEFKENGFARLGPVLPPNTVDALCERARELTRTPSRQSLWPSREPHVVSGGVGTPPSTPVVWPAMANAGGAPQAAGPYG